MNSRAKTIVILLPAFPATESETHWVPTQQQLVKTWKEQYPHLQLIVLSFYYPIGDTIYDWHGVEVRSFNGARQRKLRRVFFWNRIWKQLNHIRRENELAGIFSCWCGECALIGHYYGRRYNIAHYCWLCGQDARKNNTMVKWIRPRPEELIAMSDFLVTEFYTNHGIRPQHMIPNAIDPAAFPRELPPARDIDVLGAGSLSALKRYGLFAEVVKALQRSLPSLKAMLCGDGEDREIIQAFIRQEQLHDILLLAGELPHGEVLAAMQRTKLFLHTSSYEGFGVACLEALYAGAHVISFSKPLSRDIPHWHIVSSKEEMMAKAAALLADPATSYTPVQLYTMQDTVKAIMGLFEHQPAGLTGKYAAG